jgi:NAD(P)H-dependent FMN reductase
MAADREEVAMSPTRIAVIIGSTREGRAGESIARWFVERPCAREDVALDLIDLAGYTFPHRYPLTPTPQITDFTGRIAAAEAFVIVTPEYNHSFPAPLKQAIDYAYEEWQAKPVGFVAYGHRSAGRHAIEHLRAVFTELHAVTVRSSVTLNVLTGGDDETLGTATAMLDQLCWWGRALREARAQHPYVS